MKNILLLLTFSLIITFSTQAYVLNDLKQSSMNDLIAFQLNENDIKILKHMREEEKLARDVYDYFYIKYELPIFDNISNAEQVHMDRVLAVLTKNGIKDPASSEPGKFNNIELQQLYYDLIAQGDKSVVEALKVGATIEDVDIYDLMKFSKETKNPVILNIFKNLTCGSRNHMRAFIGILKTHDVTYTPKYITAKLFSKIIKGKHEKCGLKNGTRMGEKKGRGRGQGQGSGRGKGQGRGNRGNRF